MGEMSIDSEERWELKLSGGWSERARLGETRV